MAVLKVSAICFECSKGLPQLQNHRHTTQLRRYLVDTGFHGSCSAVLKVRTTPVVGVPESGSGQCWIPKPIWMAFIANTTCMSPAVGLENSCSLNFQFPLTHPQYHLYSSIGQNPYKVSHTINTFLPKCMKVLTQLAGAGKPLVKKPGQDEYRLRDDQRHVSY